MIEKLRHQSSYVTGTLIDESLGVYVGWVARKGSFAARMPLCNEQKDMTLIFAGEEYPDPTKIQELKARGHEFEAGGPSYLVHVAEEDRDFPRSLNGRFHGLLISRRDATLTLFNDRYAMQPLYYHEGAEAFYFAAEIKAILAVKPGLRNLDPQSLGESISCGCVLEHRTLFHQIYSLPIAAAWKFKNGSPVCKDRYFDPTEWESQEPLEQNAYYEQLKAVFSRNLPRYFAGDEKIGISLTGGLDTRMIMAWSGAPPQTLPGYTFGGSYRECADVTIARKVAAICQQPYRVIPVGKDFLNQFAHYAEQTVYLSDGCAPVSRAADLYANEIAAQIAPVRVTGNYGSEILRRLRAFKPAEPTPNLFDSAFLPYIDQAKRTYEANIPEHAVTFTAFRQAPWYQYGLLALEQTLLSLRSPFLDNDLVQTAFRAPRSGIVKSDLFENSDECNRLIADGSPALHRLPTDRGLGGSGNWSVPIARTWLEFTFKAEYAYDYGMPQWLAGIDHRFSQLRLERLFLGRHKFLHFRVWYRDALAKYVREILLDSRSLSRPYIQRRTLEEMVAHHLKGDRNYTTAITKLLTLELQHRLLLDPQ